MAIEVDMSHINVDTEGAAAMNTIPMLLPIQLVRFFDVLAMSLVKPCFDRSASSLAMIYLYKIHIHNYK